MAAGDGTQGLVNARRVLYIHAQKQRVVLTPGLGECEGARCSSEGGFGSAWAHCHLQEVWEVVASHSV